MRKTHLLVVFVLVSLTTLSFLVLIRPPQTLAEVNEVNVTPNHRSTSLDKDFFEPMFKEGATLAYETQPVISGVVPHHLVAGVQMAAFFDTLKKQAPPVVVVLGPNHKQTGHHSILTSNYSWKTPYGTILPSSDLIKNIVNQNIAAVEEKVIGVEWSVAAVTPFIKRTWPKAEIIPFIVKDAASSSTVNQLAEMLSKTLPAGSIVLASIDFSHYQPYFIADFHDVLSREILSTADSDRITKAEIDSQPSLRFLLKYNQLKQAENWHEVSHTNSAVLADHKADWLETTSHVLGYYTAGTPKTEHTITFQFFGDVMIDRSVAKVMGNKGFDYLFENIRGLENRFFKGVDVFIANLEGPFAPTRIPTTKTIAFRFDPKWAKQLKAYNFDAVSLANNHTLDMGRANAAYTQKTLTEAGIQHCGMEYQDGPSLNLVLSKESGLPEPVAFVCFENVVHTSDKEVLKAAIEAAKKQSRYVIVQAHVGTEYRRLSTTSQRDLYHWLIDQGATAVIGHHPHVVEEIEVYKGSPIVYSLGNFIFDQYFSKDTQEGLSVGVVLADGKVQAMHLFPFYGEKSKVKLMTGARRDDFLKWMNENSRLGSNTIIDGVIKL